MHGIKVVSVFSQALCKRPLAYGNRFSDTMRSPIFCRNCDTSLAKAENTFGQFVQSTLINGKVRIIAADFVSECIDTACVFLAVFAGESEPSIWKRRRSLLWRRWQGRYVEGWQRLEAVVWMRVEGTNESPIIEIVCPPDDYRPPPCRNRQS